jgi:hypothetical protein
VPARRPSTVGVVSSAYRAPGDSTLVLERLPDAPHEPDSVADAPLVAFDAFLPDHRIYGWAHLSEDRLTDLVNAQAELALVNVQIQRLSDGRTEWHEEFVLERTGLIAVRAGGPRGDPSRRRPDRLHAIAVESGPYLIGGFLHARPGVSPLDELRERPPMVPLSMGWIEHWRDGRRRDYWVGTILFNRGLADAVEVVAEEDLAFGVLTRPIRRSPAA